MAPEAVVVADIGRHVQVHRKRKPASANVESANSPKRHQPSSTSRLPSASSGDARPQWPVSEAWVTGCAVSSALWCISHLLPRSVFVAEVPADEMGTRVGNRDIIVSSYQRAPSEGVTILMPFFQSSHWNLAIASIADGQAQINIYDSLPSSRRGLAAIKTESRRRLEKIFQPARLGAGADVAQPSQPPLLTSYETHVRRSVMQLNCNDCGVAVILHAFYHVAGVSLPEGTDWLLWRRAVSALLTAGSGDGDAVEGKDGDGSNGTDMRALGALRQAHQDALHVF
ncbi:hypothetical protein Ct61P_15082 [Colletotrichum tofieldiae]|nr:hypothetical protein Ct61P_15082 [Colletotrichum tofieldiae]